MIKILKRIRSFFLKLTGINKLETKIDMLNDRLKWLQKYSMYYTDITKPAPIHGIILLQQQALKKILELVDFICLKHKLTYWLGAGYLLGIVRHNGNPIPWDDDIDIYMLWPDFEKTISLFKELFENSDFIVFFTGYSFKFMKYKNVPINFSIFPVHQYYKNIESLHEKKCIANKLLNAKTFSDIEYLKASGYTKSTYKQDIWDGKLIKTPKKLFDMQQKAKSYLDKYINEGKQPSSCGHLLSFYEIVCYNKALLWDYEWVFPLKRINFLGIEINIPNNPELYLYSHYGDFWTFPSEFGAHKHSLIKFEPEFLNSLNELINLDISEYYNKIKK